MVCHMLSVEAPAQYYFNFQVQYQHLHTTNIHDLQQPVQTSDMPMAPIGAFLVITGVPASSAPLPANQVRLTVSGFGPVHLPPDLGIDLSLRPTRAAPLFQVPRGARLQLDSNQRCCTFRHTY